MKFSAQDRDLEYLSGKSKHPSVSSDLKPPLVPVLCFVELVYLV